MRIERLIVGWFTAPAGIFRRGDDMATTVRYPVPGAGGPYPPEFRREAVELHRRSGKSLQVIAGELGVAVESLRSWKSAMRLMSAGGTA